jgi:hypothetical protein
MEKLGHISFSAVKRKATEPDNRERRRRRRLADISIWRWIVHITGTWGTIE